MKRAIVKSLITKVTEMASLKWQNLKGKNMKVFLLGLMIMVLGVFQISAQCTYKLELYDTFKDGFSGGAVTVWVNSTAVLTDVTLASGEQEFTSFEVTEGDLIEVTYVAGSWSSENEIRIHNAEDQVIYEDGADGISPTGGSVGIATCPACPAATDITLLDRTLSSLEVSWTDDNASLWSIEYGIKGFTLGTGTVVNGLISKTYEITSLDEFTWYDVYVQSDCSTDGSSIWRKAEFLTLAPCYTPSLSYFDNTTETSFDIIWSETGTAAVWDIEYVLESEDFTGIPTVTDITDLYYTVSNLEPYTSYKVKVRASCGNGEFSEWSSAGFKTTLPTCKIPSFGNAENIIQTSVDLSWTENGDATEWEIELIKASESFTGIPNVTSITSMPYVAEGLEIYTEYIYRIRANCGGGDVSPWGYTYYFTTLPNYPIPQNITFDNVTQVSADIAWEESGTATSWDIEIVEVDEDFTGIPTESALNTTTHNAINLQPATKYKVQVRANVGSGETSPWSAENDFFTEINQASNGACNMSYRIYDYTTINIPVGITENGILGIDVSLKEVRLVIEHTWNSDLDISLVSPGNQEIVLSSGHGGSADNYGDPTSSCTLYSSFMMTGVDGDIASGSAPFIGSYIPDGDFEDFNDDLTNAQGQWYLKIQDDGGGDQGSLKFVELLFEDLTPTSIHDEESTFGGNLKVYPNPAKEYLNVQLDLENNVEDIQLVIIDLSGKQVFNQQYTAISELNERIELAYLNNGLYFLNVKTSNKTEVVKVIVK